MSAAAKLPLQRPLVSRLCQAATGCDIRIATQEIVAAGWRVIQAPLRAIGSQSVAENAESKPSYHGLRLSVPTGRRGR